MKVEKVSTDAHFDAGRAKCEFLGNEFKEVAKFRYIPVNVYIKKNTQVYNLAYCDEYVEKNIYITAQVHNKIPFRAPSIDNIRRNKKD